MDRKNQTNNPIDKSQNLRKTKNGLLEQQNSKRLDIHEIPQPKSVACIKAHNNQLVGSVQINNINEAKVIDKSQNLRKMKNGLLEQQDGEWLDIHEMKNPKKPFPIPSEGCPNAVSTKANWPIASVKHGADDSYVAKLFAVSDRT